MTFTVDALWIAIIAALSIAIAVVERLTISAMSKRLDAQSKSIDAISKQLRLHWRRMDLHEVRMNAHTKSLITHSKAIFREENSETEKAVTS